MKTMEDYAKSQRDRIEAEKKKRLENIDLTLSPEEIEKRKREAQPTEIQGHEDGETKYDPESEDLDENYPIVEGKKRTKKAEEVESEEEKSPLND